MGLDWLLSDRKPKPGCEKQFHRITEKLAALDGDEQRTDLEAALEQVAVTPYEVIGAPRVGIDDAATEWFRSEVFEPMQKRLARETNPMFVAHWDRPFEAVLQEERGKYVVELAQDKEGVAAITGLMCGSLDFRGKVVALSEALPESLKPEERGLRQPRCRGVRRLRGPAGGGARRRRRPAHRGAHRPAGRGEVAQVLGQPRVWLLGVVLTDGHHAHAVRALEGNHRGAGRRSTTHPRAQRHRG